LEIIKNNIRAGNYWFVSWDSLYGNDLKHIPPSELRLMRNEIFARYGYIFKSKELQDYFMETEWYKPFFSNVDSFLKPIEKHNINFIKQSENENEEIGKEEVFNIFIDYVNNNKRAPRMLSYKFGEEHMESFGEPAGIYVAYDQVFKSEKNSKYLLYSLFAGCSDCDYEISINIFSNQGDKLGSYNVGYTNDYENVFMLDKSVLKCVMVSSESEPSDTTIILLKVNQQGEVVKN